MNRSFVILAAMALAGAAALMLMLEMAKLSPRGGEAASRAKRVDRSDPWETAARGEGSGAEKGSTGERREATDGQKRVEFHVRILDSSGNAVSAASMLGGGNETRIEDEGKDFKITGTLPLTLLVQAAGFAGPVIRRFDAPPGFLVVIRLRREVRVTVELEQPSAEPIPNDVGYVYAFGGDATARERVALQGGRGKVELAVPEGECQLWFVGERLASAGERAMLEAGSQRSLAIAPRPSGTLRVRIEETGFDPPKVSIPLVPVELGPGDAMTPAAIREATRKEGDLFVFEGLPAGPVIVTAAHSSGERILRAAATVSVGEATDVRLR
jgi:hypothetical protein